MPETVTGDVFVTGLTLERASAGCVRCCFYVESNGERQPATRLIVPDEHVVSMIEGLRAFVGYRLYEYAHN
jgi:hypothetical protein